MGSIFRTSDAAGVSRIFLSGHTPCPLDQFNRPQKEIAKTALGAEKTIFWEYDSDPKATLKALKKEDFMLIAVEQDERSISYKDFLKKFQKTLKRRDQKIAFVFGNEVEGLDKKLVNLCDHVIDIPMKGEKESLNVSVAAGIILYGICVN